MEKGKRVVITALGPHDSYYMKGLDQYKIVGRTGILKELYKLPITSPDHVACRIHLDEPLLNYIAIITLVDCKVERTQDETRKNTGI